MVFDIKRIESGENLTTEYSDELVRIFRISFCVLSGRKIVGLINNFV
jgi:hypothetical protein